MQAYSQRERLLSRYLSYIPFIKKLAKYAYMVLMYQFYRKKDKFLSDYEINRVYNDYNFESFGGYYDKNPQNNNNGLVLCHLSNHSTSRTPNSRYPIYVSVIDLDNHCLRWKKTTKAFNWQQGARLQWLDNSLFAYNDFDEHKMLFITKVIDINNFKEANIYNKPIQDSFGNKYFLSLNYQRLYTLRPEYGYDNLGSMTNNDLNEIDDDGIWKVDFKTGKEQLLISLKKIIELQYKSWYSKVHHKVNHIMISPDGSHFIFIHRCFRKGRRIDRLICADSESGDMKVLSDNEMVSHCCWLDNREILGFLRGDNKVDGYWLIDINSNEKHIIDLFNNDFYGDGHPTTDGKRVIIDCYPDKARIQHLWCFDLDKKEIKDIGSFYHGFKYDGISRCDLHPRLSKSKNLIFFDSVFSGTRQMYYVKVPLL